MKILLYLFVSFLLTANYSPHPMPQEIEKTNEWTGKTRDVTHVAAAPDSGLVADNETWKVLWKKWKPGEEIPEIDFDKDFVLIQQVRGPNTVMISNLSLNDGHLSFQTGASRMGGPGYGFSLLQISREGIQTVKQGNGKVELPALSESETETESGEGDSTAMETTSGFKTISFETVGGIAGLMQVEKITPDGKAVTESKRDGKKQSERQLNDEQLQRLQKFVEATNWAEVPETSEGDPNVSDQMTYIFTIETEKRTFKFEYDSLSNNKTIETLRLLIYGVEPKGK